VTDPRRSSVRRPDVSASQARSYRAQGWWDSRTLADGIEAAAARRPDAVAVADAERHLSYAELAREVAAGVTALDAHEVHAGDSAILVAGNRVSAVVAYHALLRVGATTLLLDRRCGIADVEFALEALPDAAILAEAGERQRQLAGVGRPAMPLETFAEHTSAARVSAPGGLDRDAPAVVLFTSGTTSRPKAVVHSLNTLTAGAANMARITGADDSTTAFLVSPLSSIAGVMQMHLVADRHGALVLEDRFDPEASLDRINQSGATLLGGAPVIAERLLRAAQARGLRRLALRTLALGGSMLPRPLLELAHDGFGIRIARVYGSSEAPNFAGSLPNDDRERRLADDGALMPGNEVRVGSSAHPHEGMLRGPNVFLGYLDADDQAAAFEDGWFRTGDLVELHDGRLTVLGRLKAVVDRNGLKISLDEMDVALAGLPDVSEYACFARPDASTGERLAVAVQPEDDASVTLDDVVAYLLGKGVARRKLPEELVIWDGPLPRTASGKVVRAQLVMDAAAKRAELAPRVRGA